VSFCDLGDHPWGEICDPGTVESFDTSEWSHSADAVRRREFVELLNRTLASQLYPDVRHWDREDCYAMSGLGREKARKRSYRSVRAKSTLTVVAKYERESADGRHFEWFRHLAFRGQFRLIEETWYLEITPTYRFTMDGLTLDRFHESRLKGIKGIEKNRAVLSSVLYWADYLTTPAGLYDSPLLTFGNLLSFPSEVGISDDLWSANDQTEGVRDDDTQEQLSLLEGSEGGWQE
jgi:hypothetical protein